MTTMGRKSTGNRSEALLDERSSELSRLNAEGVQLSLDDDFEPKVGTLLKVEVGLAFWHILPEEFRTIVGDLPDGADSDAIKKAIEMSAMHVWHGPAPKSRTTSP